MSQALFPFVAPLAKVFDQDFTLKTPERLQAKTYNAKEMRDIAEREVASFFPTSEVAEVHKFFYRDPYRFAAMVDRLLRYKVDGNWLRKAYRAFYDEKTLPELMYPDEWYKYTLIKKYINSVLCHEPFFVTSQVYVFNEITKTKQNYLLFGGVTSAIF